MENQITCPHCQRIIFNNLIIDDAAKRKGSDTQFLICECGERIKYLQITDQLKNQKKISTRIQNQLHGLFKSPG